MCALDEKVRQLVPRAFLLILFYHKVHMYNRRTLGCFVLCRTLRLFDNVSGPYPNLHRSSL